MLYDIGLKVTITNTNPRSNKSTLYGHTCRIKRRYERNRYDSYAMDTYSYAYDIEWCPEDNPGREMDFDPSVLLWTKYDFVPYRTTPGFFVNSVGLPDV